jgi:phenylpropionate dioxygenase-like ring-hydroxylating dioxygenase large terminal subunit
MSETKEAWETDEFEFRDGIWVVEPNAAPESSGAKAPAVDYGDAIVKPERFFSREEMEREWEGLWTKVWNFTGLVSDIPAVGDYFRCEIGRESFIVVRTAADTIKAFYNVCPHRGNMIAHNDFGTVAKFTCSFHSWEFSLDGKLTRITDEEMFSPNLIQDRPGLKEVRVDIWAGLVFINMDDNAEPLISFLGVLPNQLAPYNIETFRVFSDIVQPWEANWKTALDAFIEIYHAHVVHPELNAVLDEARVQYDAFPKGHGRFISGQNLVSPREPRSDKMNDGLRAVLAQFGMNPDDYDGPVDNIRAVVPGLKRIWAEKNGLDFSGLTDSQLTNLWTVLLFPNVTLNLNGDSVLIQQWRPHATDPLKLTYHVITLLPNTEAKVTNLGGALEERQVTFDPKTRPARVYSTNGPDIGYVLHQDFQAIPRVQRGLRSRAFKGLRLCREELLIRHHLAEIDRYLEGIGTV